MTHIFGNSWFKTVGLKQHMDQDKLTDYEKLLLCSDHYYAISGRLATQRGESKKLTGDDFKTMEPIPEKELEKEIEKTLKEWQEIFNKLYDEWKNSGVKIERIHQNETIFTFPWPHPPGFRPEKQKTNEKQRRNVLAGVKRKVEKREKMKKELPQKRVVRVR